jgi:hypothetical protein
MADPVTLVILVAVGEAASPAATAMTQGAHDAFAGTVTEVRETPTVPTDSDALSTEGTSRPDAVAELIWRDAEHRRATLRVHLRQSRRWIERSFTFAATDPAAERGRTLGFAVASILPEAAKPAPPTSAPTPAQTSMAAQTTTQAAAAAQTFTPAQAAAPAQTPTPSQASTAQPSSPSQSPSPTSASTRSQTSAPGLEPSLRARSDADSPGRESASLVDAGPLRDPRLGIDLLAAGETGIDGPQAAGGGAALEWFALRMFSLRVGAIERAGTLDVAHAVTSTLVTSVGVAVRPWQPTRSVPFSVSLRADYILVRQSATHFDSDDLSPVTDARWLSGADSFVDGSWLLSSQIAAVAGVGLEDVGSPTYVLMRDVRVATLPALRAVAEAGFQLRF